MKGYLINLDSSRDRLEVFEQNLLERGFERIEDSPLRWQKDDIEIERVSAVYGKAYTEEELRRFVPEKVKFWDWMAHELTPGEVGCFLSHRKVWQKIVEEAHPYAFVIEDDMIFSPKILDFFNSASWIPANADFVKLDFSPVSNKHLYPVSRPVGIIGDRKIVRMVGRTYGTGCYVISLPAAESCVKHSERLPLPVDLFMFDARFDFAPRHRLYGVFPALALDNGRPTATIQDARHHGDLSVAEYVLKGVYSVLRRVRLKWFMKKYGLEWEQEEFRT